MASSLSSLERDLTCGICKGIYKEPLVLRCPHTFCKACLEKHWAGIGAKKCPRCRKRTRSENPPVSEALKKVCEYFLQEKTRPALSEPQGLQCPQHAKTLSLFCLDDEMLVCEECINQEHQMHILCNTKKAISDRKKKAQAWSEALNEKQAAVNSTITELHKIATKIQSQVQQTERQIMEEFKKLHQFLTEEEKARITALKEDEKKKSWKITDKIGTLNGIQSKLSGRGSKITRLLESDEASFLQNFKGAEKRAQTTVLNLELDSGALIDVTKHLGNLRYRVWEKMKNVCPYYPVILDPNSANSILTVSEDLSTVTHKQQQDLPDNPERFSVHPFVLGSEGFVSGTHSWVVEVGNRANWMIGVAKESVQRKEKRESCPENGIWHIRFRNNKYSFNVSNPSIRYQRIKVELDLSAGQVVFFNSDTDEKLHSFTGISGEKIYPLFLVYDSSSIKVLQATTSI